LPASVACSDLPKTVKDGDNNVTTYGSYAGGIPQAITYADSSAESASVRYDGRVTSWTDADGNTTTYGYDAIGRLKQVTYPTDSPAYSSRYIAWNTSAAGWSKTETVGSYTEITTYDALLRPVLTNEANTRYVRRSFDADGHTTFQSYASSGPGSGLGLTSVYDGLGRLKSQTDAGGYGTYFTPGANTLTVQDRDLNSTTYTFKTYDTPSTAWPVSIRTPIVTTSITRDTWGKPTSIKRGGVNRQRTYNYNQLLSSATDPERSDALTFDYDAAGNLSHVYRNGSQAEKRSYDSRNRLTSITYPSGDPSVSLAYFSSGALKSQSRGSNSHSYTYDARHGVKSETIKTNAGTYALSYGHDALAHLSSIGYPDGTSINLSPDTLGRPSAIGTFAKSIGYYANGAVSAFTYGNGIAHSMTQSADGRQLPAEVSDATVSDLTYAYDGNSFPLTINDSLHAANNRTLTYDAGNRLYTAYATGLWGSATYTYDTLDNLTADRTGPGNPATMSFGIDAATNLPTAITVGSASTALSYDGEGNLKKKGTGAAATTYAFDSANELTQVVQGGTTYSYSYDGKGLRATSSSVSGTAQGQQTNSVYNAAGQLVYETVTTTVNPDRVFANGFEPAVAPTQTTKYFYLGSHAVAKEVTAGTTVTDTYLHTDGLGSTIAQTDSNGKVIGTSMYLPYGGLFSSTGTGNAAGIGYAGQYADGTGLVYMRARYFDPQLRRFISLDPVDVDAGSTLNFNRYGYASNSPYAKYDPSGLYTCQDDLQHSCLRFAVALFEIGNIISMNPYLSSNEQQRLSTILGLYGNEGDPGVHVSFAAGPGYLGMATYSPLPWGENVSFSSDPRPNLSFYSTIIHEGQHAVDDFDRRSDMRSFEDRHQTEINAYTSQAIFNRAANGSSNFELLDGSGGYDQQAIENAAQDSISAACGGGDGGVTCDPSQSPQLQPDDQGSDDQGS